MGDGMLAFGRETVAGVFVINVLRSAVELCYNMMLFFTLLATDSRTKRQPKSEGSVLNTGSWWIQQGREGPVNQWSVLKIS